MNYVLSILGEMGFKNLNLAASSLTNIHAPVIPCLILAGGMGIAPFVMPFDILRTELMHLALDPGRAAQHVRRRIRSRNVFSS